MNSFDGISKKVNLSQFNQSLSFECFINELINNDSLTFCRRRFKFHLFSLNNLTNLFDQVGVIIFPENYDANKKPNAILNLTKQLSFRINQKNASNSNSKKYTLNPWLKRKLKPILHACIQYVCLVYALDIGDVKVKGLR